MPRTATFMMVKKIETKMQTILSKAHHDYDKMLNARAYFKLNDHAIGEDLVQDTFLKTWKYLLKGGKIDMMKAFLYHILNNLIIDEYRKNKTSSLDFLMEKGFDISNENHERLFDIMDGKTAALLIDELPKKYQNVMRLKYLKDLTLQEISLITGQSKNTIAVQTYRGLEKLKALYNSKFNKTDSKS